MKTRHRMVRPWVICLVAVACGWSSAGGGDPRRTGDLLGRDLDFAGYGELGHVGLWTGWRVLEVLNESPPIQKRPLASYKEISVFWGARYLPERRNYRRVIRKAWEQRLYRPKFTLAPEYRAGKFVTKRVWDKRAGKWEKRTVMVRGRFRCDSFVTYAYKAGLGYRVKGSGTVPAKMFASFGNPR